MDLNVKLLGLKYNYERVQGVFAKLSCVGYFLNYLNYFSKEKA
jgi:hypothetical protein